MGVIIGMDPHKRSATIEVIDERAVVLAAGRYGTDKAGYGQMLAAARTFADRVWAVESCNGIGRHLAHRLVHDGETVLDVPPKLSAQVRVFATGKTDEVDAHSVALAALRAPGLVRVRIEEDLVVLGMLADRRDELGRARTQVVNRLLLELLPGVAKKFLSARQARTALASVRPRDLAGRTRRRRAAELISELEAIDKKSRALDKELTGLVTARVHPDGPARHRTLGRGPAARRRRRHPPVRQPGPVRLLERDRAAGRLLRQPVPSMTAMRALKRRLSNVAFARMLADQKRREAGPGGQPGTQSDSSVAGPDPRTPALRTSHIPDRHSTA